MPQELFTVLAIECMACGAPELVAPDLMEQHGDLQAYWSCRFLRQPETPAEFEQAIAAVNASCCGAVVYTGTDRTILARIHRQPWANPAANSWRAAMDGTGHGSGRDYARLNVARRILSGISLAMVAWFFVSAVTVQHLTTGKMWGGLAVLCVAIALFSATRRM